MAFLHIYCSRFGVPTWLLIIIILYNKFRAKWILLFYNSRGTHAHRNNADGSLLSHFHVPKMFSIMAAAAAPAAGLIYYNMCIFFYYFSRKYTMVLQYSRREYRYFVLKCLACNVLIIITIIYQRWFHFLI